MSKVSIEIKVWANNFKISLNLMTTPIKNQILPNVWTWDRNRGGLQIPPIHFDLKILVETI
jgi:hypothetical protein